MTFASRHCLDISEIGDRISRVNYLGMQCCKVFHKNRPFSVFTETSKLVCCSMLPHFAKAIIESHRKEKWTC